MKTDIRRLFKNSIATRLLKVVFSLYLVIAIGVTLGHMFMEYRHQKNSIREELKDIQKTFEQGIALDLWQMNQTSLHSTVEGMLRIPVIVGVKIKNSSKLDVAVGGIIRQENSVGNVGLHVDLLGLSQLESAIHENEEYELNLFKHQFPIIYAYEKDTKQMGIATIYSNTSVVVKRVKLGFLLLIFNAVIKTAALWLIFVLFSNILLRRPLESLAVATKKITLDNIDSFRIKIGTSGENELSIIESSFNTMIDNLYHSITERKQEEERYRKTIESSIDGFWITDINGKFLNVNDAYCQMIGYSRDELFGMSIMDVEKLESREETEQRIQKIIKDGSSRFETKHRHKNNKIIDVEISTTYTQDGGGMFFVFIRDITEQKQMEKDIQALVESTVGIIGQDFFDKIIKKLCKWLGCECAIVGEIVDTSTVHAIAMEVEGKPIDDYSYELAGTPCGNVIEKGFCVYPEDVCKLFPEDTELVEMNAVGYIGTPLLNRNSEPIGVLCAISRNKLNLPKRIEAVINIIAARVSAEIERTRMGKEQKKLESQLHQAQKMESIGTLAGGIAHDFNNILSPIIGYAEMLLEDIPSENRQHDSVREILHSALRASDLTKQILAFGRKVDYELKPLNIQVIIKEVIKLIRATIPTTIEIKYNLYKDCGPVISDPTQIHQVAMNLITNAFHSMEDEGGILEVNLSEVELKQSELHGLDIKAGAYACLSVSDTGKGIDKSIIDDIFNPYFTTKEQGKGTGLGLSVVHGIVKSFNGDVLVNSEARKGTTFLVYLPIIKKRAKIVVDEELSALKRGTESVLLVDDEVPIIKMEQQMLERLGYRVTSRTSSIEALEEFRSSSNKFDLVITDMTMPDMTGDKLALELKQIRKEIPVILCTGFSTKMDNEKAEALGIDSLIIKPIVKSDLAQTVRAVLDRKQGG